MTYTLVEWYGADGDAVAEGAVVALVETSKSSEDLLAPAGGILHRAVDAKSERAHGDIVGYLFESNTDRLAFLAGHPRSGPDAAAAQELIVTEPARFLIERAGLDLDRLRGLGKTVIKRSDVEALLEALPATAGGTRYPLSRQQRGVADVVTRSHLSIPAAFTVIRVDASRVATIRRELHGAVGVVEVLIKAVAELRDRHPLFFGTYQDDASVLVPDGAHVAVTVDAGNGLFLPVVRNAAALSLAQVGDLLTEFQGKARHSSFRAKDFAGANIGLSLTNYTDVLFTQPIISPGTSCMLALSGTHREAEAGPGGTVVVRSWFTLGIAYDHRVVNGRDAVVFLREIKRTLERGSLPAPVRG